MGSLSVALSMLSDYVADTNGPHDPASVVVALRLVDDPTHSLYVAAGWQLTHAGHADLLRAAGINPDDFVTNGMDW